MFLYYTGHQKDPLEIFGKEWRTNVKTLRQSHRNEVQRNRPLLLG